MEQFRNEIVWERSTNTGSSKAGAKRFPTNHDIILSFARSKKVQFQLLYRPYSDKYVKKYYSHNDGDGMGRYQLQALATVSSERLARLKKEGRLVYGKGRYPRFKGDA